MHKQLQASVLSALPKSGKTILWLLKIILPVSLAVSILQYYGVISLFGQFLSPVFIHLGLPGESAIIFISSLFLALYAPIAILTTLALDMREITILALMCLISHNMIVETAIQKRAGSSAVAIFLLRIITSFVAAYLLNLVLPGQLGSVHVVQKSIVPASFTDMLLGWLVSSAWLVLKISLIITGLMILQNVLKEFKVLDLLSKAFAPLMRLIGLSENCSFLWIVAQTIGLTYGSAVLIEELERGEIQASDADLLNYHIAINHSLLEDTLLFAAIGVPIFWITIPRVLLAVIAVWSKRAYLHFSK